RVLGKALPIRCAVNAQAAREDELDALPAVPASSQGRAVAVVGGGPAGMEAARVAALRGYHAVLFERAGELGGTLNIADKTPLKEKLTRLTRTLARQCEVAGVEVRLGCEATPADVAALDPAAVIVACGATPKVPASVPGIDGPRVCTAEDVITGVAEPIGKVAVIGGGLTGLEAAEVLLDRGLDVTIVGRAPMLGRNVFGAILNDQLSRIMPHDPTVLTGSCLEEVRDGAIVVRSVADGALSEVAVDWVVLALGVSPRCDVVEAFEQAPELAGVPVVAAGDAAKSGRVAEAVCGGFEAAFALQA
ncbi:MAG: FAD-dependent oxidoreductase, partial [Coriobacteriia bacterium]|nr:FAD-dependent oxidoreductase [Coriobacteriia bacterium]